MKNTYGNILTITLFGESHGPVVGAVLDGMAPGIPVNEAHIARALAGRAGLPSLSTARREPDRFSIVSGVKDGLSCGTPLTILIENQNVRSEDYAEFEDLPRPGHADYASRLKYHGFAPIAGGGHFSGRITAPLVAAGSIVQEALAQKGIRIGTHILRLHGISDDPLPADKDVLAGLCSSPFPVLNQIAQKKMLQEIKRVRDAGDSVGGILETVVLGVPAGLGEPWFDTVEGCLSHALFSIPAVKGVSFGDGFSLADMTGSQANDPLKYADGAIVTATEHAGGVFGGVTIGAPLRFSVVVKPASSISIPQQTLRLSTNREDTLRVIGRHDPAVVCRVPAIVDAVSSLVIADFLAIRFGTDWLAPKKDS